MKNKILFTVIIIAAIFQFNYHAVSESFNTGKTIIRFALIVGNSLGGPGTKPLRYTAKDAESIASMINRIGGVEDQNIKRLFDPDIDDFEYSFYQMDQLIRKTTIGDKRVEFIFYYSGHSDDKNLLFYNHKFTYKKLKEKIKSLPVDIRIVILDSCQSGALIRSKGGDHSPPFMFDSTNESNGHAYLTSCRGDELAHESDSIQSSFFTDALRSGLLGAADTNGDGNVTLDETYQYVLNETRRLTDEAAAPRQHPSYEINLAGTGNIILTNIRENNARLIFPQKVTGNLLIRDSNKNKIVEFFKPQSRQMELSLPPGKYEIQLYHQRYYYTGIITLKKNESYTLASTKKFRKIRVTNPNPMGTTHYFSLALEGGFDIPFGKSYQILDNGIEPLLFGYYNIVWNPVILGIGVGTGGFYNRTLDEYPIDYELYSFPLLLSVKLGIAIQRIQFSVVIGGGVALNVQDSPIDGINSLYALKPVFTTSLAAGFSITNTWQVELFTKMVFRLFDDNYLSGFTPGIRINMNF